MRYCKNCHILYSSIADACPKCGIKEPPKSGEGPVRPDKKAVRRDWLLILIGVPALIAAIYALITLLNK